MSMRDRIARALAGVGAIGAGAYAAQPTDAEAMFAGRLAKTANNAALKEAKALEAKGWHPDQIVDATGWHKRADKKWRFEISDRPATLYEDVRQGLPFTGDVRRGWARGDVDTRLGELLNHPELYRAYPDLMNVPVSRMATKDAMAIENPRGSYIPEQQRIYLREDLSPEQARQTLLHEIQHGIQQAERFSPGGSTTTRDVIKRADQRYENMIANAEYSVEALRRQMWSWADEQAAARGFDSLLKMPGNEQQLLLKQWKDANPDLVRRMDEAYNIMQGPPGLRSQLRFDTYHSLQGEAEARNTAARADLTPEQRYLLRPYVTEDMPRSEQWTRKPVAVPQQPATFDERFGGMGALAAQDQYGGMQ